MGMLVSGARFAAPFIPKTKVYTASQNVAVPAGATKASIYALGPGGTGMAQGSFDSYWGGGGGEMRVLADVALSGGTLSLTCAIGSSTSVAYQGSTLVSANPGQNANYSGGNGGSGGSGGVGYLGGGGNTGTQTQGELGGGGGAAGTDGNAGGGGVNTAGARGPGRSFTDTDTGTTYTNGAGDQLYGGGTSGRNFQQSAQGGFVAIIFS